jgi:hypothetical protein
LIETRVQKRKFETACDDSVDTVSYKSGTI